MALGSWLPDGPPPFPNIGFPDTIMSLIGHIVYASPVALPYAFVTND